MNKSGHVSTAIAAGSSTLLLIPSLSASTSLWPAIALVIGAAIGGLIVDLDHKTGTVSNMIQLSAKWRHQLKFWSLCLFFIGSCIWGWNTYGDPGDASGLSQTAPFWIIGALICGLAARLRILVLFTIGGLLLWGVYQNGLHWSAAVAGVSFLIIPFVKHRGIIHSPEFALLLSYSLWVLSNTQGPMIQGLLFGVIIGWWTHLVVDCFGREGISSWLMPRFNIALRLFQNGGYAERWIATLCWTISSFVWLMLLSRNLYDFGFMTFSILQ